MSDEESYRIEPGDGVPWRDLSRTESHRPPARDVAITDVSTMSLQGNFKWGIVKVDTDAGEYGVGETFLARAAIDIVDRLRSDLVGENPLDVNRLCDYKGGSGPQERSAFAGVEIALWDLKGKLLGVPVYELLGGTYRDEVRLYCDAHAGGSLGEASGRDDAGIYRPEAYATAAREVVDDGFDALKFDLDVKLDDSVDTAAGRLGNDAIEHKVDVVAAVRDEIGSGVDLAVDLHWNFTVETATRLAERLEPFDLAWIEDPVSPTNATGHRRVAEATRTPTLTGENLATAGEFHRFLRQDAMDVAAPDANKCGGLREFQRIAALAELFDVPVAPHNVVSPVGTVAAAHAAASIPNFVALEYHARDVPWWGDLVSRTAGDGPIIRDGSIPLPEGPGLGVELDREVAAEHLVEGSTLLP